MATYATVTLYLLLLYIAIVDYRERRISNRANTLVAINAALLFFLHDHSAVIFVVINLSLIAAIFMPGYPKGLVGGGDIKLFCSLSLCWSPLALLWSLGTGIALLLLFYGALALKNRIRLIEDGMRKDHSNEKLFSRMPLGTALFSGAMATQLIALLENI